MPSMHRRRSFLLCLAAAVLAGCASDGPDVQRTPDDEALASLPVKVLMVQGFADVHRALAARLIIPTQIQTETGYGTIPAIALAMAPHLQEGDSVDVVVAPVAVLEQLQAQGLVRRGSLLPVVQTPLAAAVAAGRTLPPLQSEQDVRALLQSARAIAYPSSEGSAFIEKQLLPQLGMADTVLPKSIKVFGPQVAQLVARGDAELGLQLRSELQQSGGIRIVGDLPAPLAYAAVYGVAIAAHAPSAAGAQALARFYQREAAQHDWAGTGWEAPAAGRQER
ncbi:substrate-binding domain-containing protein [Comamonas testosteroni]